MSEWIETKLSELCCFTAGTAFKKSLQGRNSGEIPFIKVSDMNLSGNEFYIKGSNNWVMTKDIPNIKKKLHPENSTVFAKIGEALKANRRRLLTEPTIIDNNMMSAVANEATDPTYLYYVLSGIDFNQYYEGSALPYLSAKTLNDIDVFIVKEKGNQKRLVSILKSLDDKIENNRRMNETLEGMAQAIFKSWFVDFDPVHAKAEALKNGGSEEDTRIAAMCAISGKSADALAQLKSENPDDYAQLSHTADAFPSAFVDSDLGQIPEGWEVKTIESLSEKISKGTTPSKSALSKSTEPDSILFIKVKDISNNGEIEPKDLDLIPQDIHEGVLKRSILQKNDILFSIAGTIGRVALVNNDLKNSNANQAVSFIRLQNTDLHLNLIYMSLRSKRLQSKALSSIVQGVQANLSLNNVGKMEVIMPNNDVLLSWNKVSKNIIGTIKFNFKNNQFHAVREAVKATIAASSEDGNKKAGVVWHTQGSGKSISMCCYAGMLLQQKEMNNPTLIVVTDRNDLDGQLFSTFGNAEALLKQRPVQADGRDELRRLLAERESGGIIFTTVQKFSPLDGEDEHPILNDRHNIVVISDEAHRSQYGLKAKLNKDGTYKYGYAKHMRDAIPNAAFIGFTGTPISFEDKDTRSVFGDYVSVYDIQDAVDDGATVPIYYESRLAKLDINREEIEALSDQVDEVIEDEEDTGAREKTKGEWSRLEKLVGSNPRLKDIAADFVTHFETRNKSMDGKAMIVGMSREICVHLYNEIIALRPEWHDTDPTKGAIKIIMTGSASDQELLQPHIYNKQTKKDLEKRFKEINDPLKVVIVRDMWLTGFDAPCCNTMYIDKPMKGHNLMQAIARVNRVFKDKPGGLVVDYIGIANELKQALKIYTDAKGKGAPTLNAEEAFSILLEKLDAARGMFEKTNKTDGFDYSDYETNAHALLVSGANYILSLEDGKKRFLDIVLAMTKAYSLCSTLDQAKEIKTEIAFFSALKAAITKFTTVDKKLNQEEKNSALKQILDNAIVAEGVSDVFELCGLDKPNIGLLSDEFLEDVRQMPEKNLAVELLEKLLKDDIRAKTKNNVVQEKKYSDRLYETLRKYNNRAIETAQVIEELIQMAKDFQDDLKRESDLGLNGDEVAFYDALANNESASRILGDKTLKKIAVEITEKLRKSTTVDWQVRDSVRAKLRILVRRTLQRYKYPPDQEKAAIDLVLKQAEVLSNSWTK